jgi:preprotein translocase subunit Sec61beta
LVSSQRKETGSCSNEACGNIKFYSDEEFGDISTEVIMT